MKKIIALLVLVGLFASNSAYAVHNVYNYDGTKVVSTISDELWAEAMVKSKVYGTSKLPLFRAGETVVDEYGVILKCEWFMFMGCQNPTKTEAYREAMRGLARDLIARGWDWAFPIFAGWVASVR